MSIYTERDKAYVRRYAPKWSTERLALGLTRRLAKRKPGHVVTVNAIIGLCGRNDISLPVDRTKSGEPSRTTEGVDPPLSSERLSWLVNLYAEMFEESGVSKERIPARTRTSGEWQDVFGHCYAELDDVKEAVRQGRFTLARELMKKIQACVWAMGSFSERDIRDQNTP